MKPQNPSSKPKRDNKKNYLKLAGLGFELVVINVIIIFGGYRLDVYLQNSVPWMVLLAVLVAVVGSLYYLLKRIS